MRYFVEFEFKQVVRGYVDAKSAKQAKAKALECSNPTFDEMIEYTMSSDPDIEFEACYREEKL